MNVFIAFERLPIDFLKSYLIDINNKNRRITFSYQYLSIKYFVVVVLM